MGGRVFWNHLNSGALKDLRRSSGQQGGRHDREHTQKISSSQPPVTAQSAHCHQVDGHDAQCRQRRDATVGQIAIPTIRTSIHNSSIFNPP
jgi:hypothetical protein